MIPPLQTRILSQIQMINLFVHQMHLFFSHANCNGLSFNPTVEYVMFLYVLHMLMLHL